MTGRSPLGRDQALRPRRTATPRSPRRPCAATAPMDRRLTSTMVEVLASSTMTDNDLGLQLQDLPIGSMRLARVDGRRLCLVRTADGVHALDHACPHEGYGLTQGTLDGNLLTCAWHNWKFRVDDGTCVLGEEDVRAHPVTVAWRRIAGRDDQRAGPGRAAPAPARQPAPRDRARLRGSGLPRRHPASACRRQPGGARVGGRRPRRAARPSSAGGTPSPRPPTAWPWSTSTTATSGHCRSCRESPGSPRSSATGPSTSSRIRRPSSAATPAPSSAASSRPKSWRRPKRWCAAPSTPAGPPTSCGRGSPAVISDHLLSYGHGAIYTQKAFQLLDRLGWERADTVLPHLVPTIVYGTREGHAAVHAAVHEGARRGRPGRAQRRRSRPDVARRRPLERAHC